MGELRRRAGEASENASSNEEEPETIWQGLLDGHFSLVEHFERDGHLYLVVRHNLPREPGLSTRERKLVAWAARGFANAEIASEMSVSEHSVADHLANAARKLGLSSREALVTAAAAFVDMEPGSD